MEDDFPNNLKKELDEVFGIPTREVVESTGHSSRYNTFVSLGDFVDISYVSNLVGVSGGWELNPPEAQAAERTRKSYEELFV